MKKNYKYLKYLLLAVILFSIIEIRIELFFLTHAGVETDGYIIDVRGTGSKGAILTEYTFYVNEKKYYSTSTNVENPQAGNLIKIVYLPLFPSISQPFEHLQKFK